MYFFVNFYEEKTVAEITYDVRFGLELQITNYKYQKVNYLRQKLKLTTAMFL